MQQSAGKTETIMQRRLYNVWADVGGNPSLLPFVGLLRKALQGCESALDIGCGGTSPMRFVRGLRVTGLDGYPPALEEARKSGTHDDYVLGNVTRLGEAFPNRKFDACVALDLIEHLQKEDGRRLFDEMERLARKRVVIATPNGFLPQKSKNGDLQEHLSGWTADEMRERGYKVFGMYGPKSLRGEYHLIIKKPRAFWTLVSLSLHYLDTLNHPEKAAALFCVKEVG